MKSLRVLATTLLTASAMILPAFASGDDPGKKGIFYEQLDHPDAKMNVGIQYWIEVEHNGQPKRADNHTVFYSGDKLHFHVRPNVTGYAYIVFRSGDGSEPAVLFPQGQEDNQVIAGQDVIVPGRGALVFDNNPGIEKLSLVVSRKEIDSNALLNPKQATDDSVKVAMNFDPASKDLVPSSFVVAYSGGDNKAYHPQSGASAKTESTFLITHGKSNVAAAPPKAEPAPRQIAMKLPNEKKHDEKTEPVKAAAKPSPEPTKVASKPAPVKVAAQPKKPHVAKTKHASESRSQIVKVESADTPTPIAAVSGKNGEPTMVTVVYKDPNGVLMADISLKHESHD